MTIRALRSDTIKEAYANQYPDAPVTGPVTGKIYSNFRVISSTVKVTDKKGNTIYSNEIFTGVSDSMNEARDRYQNIDLAQVHGDAFAAAAQSAGMIDGSKYIYTVKVLLSNGETKTIVQNGIFTYTAE